MDRYDDVLVTGRCKLDHPVGTNLIGLFANGKVGHLHHLHAGVLKL